MTGMSGLFQALDIPQGESFGPSPGFHVRVLRRIAEEARPSLWDWFCPAVVSPSRGVCFVCLAGTALLREHPPIRRSAVG